MGWSAALKTGILKGSIFTTLEDISDFTDGKSWFSVRVLERYSFGEKTVPA